MRTLYLFGLWVVCFFISPRAIAQKIQWDKTLGGKQADYLMDALATPDYGFILAGSSLSAASGSKSQNAHNLDYWIWKMNEKGEPEWQKNFGGTGSDYLYSIALTPDAGYILAGTSNSPKSDDKLTPHSGLDDVWVLKLNARGEIEWQVTLGGFDQEKVHRILPCADGYLIAGSSASPDFRGNAPATPETVVPKKGASYGDLDFWVVKLKRTGEVAWQRTYGGQYVDELRSVATAPAGGFLLGGYSNSPESGTKTQPNRGTGDFWVVRIDGEGNELWQRTLGGERDDQLQALIRTYDDAFLLGGNSNSPGSHEKTTGNQEGTDLWVLKMDDSGTLLWQKTYNFGKTDVLTSLVENDDHSVLIGGYAQGEYSTLRSKTTKRLPVGGMAKAKKGTDDYIALKIDEKGEELWSRTVGSHGCDLLRKVIETRDGGYLMAGTSNAKASGDKSGSQGRYDFWIVKLKDEQKPPKVKLMIEASPNPTYGFTSIVIGYDFEKGTATVVDLNGRVMQQFPIQSRTVPVDLSALPEGIYIVNISTNVQSDGVKIMKKTTKN